MPVYQRGWKQPPPIKKCPCCKIRISSALGCTWCGWGQFLVKTPVFQRNSDDLWVIGNKGRVLVNPRDTST